jgi:hypothetical protein
MHSAPLLQPLAAMTPAPGHCPTIARALPRPWPGHYRAIARHYPAIARLAVQ